MNNKLDTLEFGVLYDKKSKTPQKLLEEMQKIFINKCEIFIYYNNKIYNNEYSRLAYELKFRNIKRCTFVAFLYFKLYDVYIPIFQSSRANYLTFNVYGLNQYNLKSQHKYFFLKNILKKLFEYNYKIKVIKMDIAIDVFAEYSLVLEYIEPLLNEKDRKMYIYKKGETAYFNPAYVNNLIEEQKKTNENLNCSQKNRYMRIVCYNKTIKDNLLDMVTRIEFSFRGKIQRLNNFVTSISDIESLVNKLYNISNKYLNYEF